MRTGSSAAEIAVLTKQAAAPASIASAACDGRPMPASTTTGKSVFSIRISMKGRVKSPRLLPIGDPRGMIAAAPASSTLEAGPSPAVAAPAESTVATPCDASSAPSPDHPVDVAAEASDAAAPASASPDKRAPANGEAAETASPASSPVPDRPRTSKPRTKKRPRENA